MFFCFVYCFAQNIAEIIGNGIKDNRPRIIPVPSVVYKITIPRAIAAKIETAPPINHG